MADVELPNTEKLAEMRSKRSAKRIALTTAIYAVILAIASLGGSNAMKEMLLAQQEASNKWSYYQAKNMRENLYRIQRMNLEADFLERGDSMKPKAHAKFEETIKKMADEESRYAREKTDIEREARKAEHERDTYKRRDPYFDFAEALLQISIVMASIAILSSSRLIFFFSLIIAGTGTILACNGFAMVFRLPFLG